MSDLPRLDGPYEFLEMFDGTIYTFHAISWDLGTAMTQPPWKPEGQLQHSVVLRIHLPTTEKPLFPYYYDFGQKTLVPQLVRLLPAAKLQGVGIMITPVGHGAKKRVSVGLETAQPE